MRSHLWFVALADFSQRKLFLISHPCNPLWHKDGCWRWLRSNIRAKAGGGGRSPHCRALSHPLLDNRLYMFKKYSQIFFSPSIMRGMFRGFFLSSCWHISITFTRYTERYCWELGAACYCSPPPLVLQGEGGWGQGGEDRRKFYKICLSITKSVTKQRWQNTVRRWTEGIWRMQRCWLRSSTWVCEWFGEVSVSLGTLPQHTASSVQFLPLPGSHIRYLRTKNKDPFSLSIK